ncbi:uncharacterized protein [Taeniopygia guttata]|uniref:uncharacterized protein n=1 Tax=Taeniopygia guttata TaxID=59729 RepID=UPI003BB979E6
MAEYPARRMLGEQPLPSDPAAAVTPPPLVPAAGAEGRGQRRRTARNGSALRRGWGGREEGEEEEQRSSLGCAPSASRGRRGPALGAGPAGRGAAGCRRSPPAPPRRCWPGTRPAQIPFSEGRGRRPGVPGQIGPWGSAGSGRSGALRSSPRPCTPGAAGASGDLPRVDALPWRAPQLPERVSHPPRPCSVNSLWVAERRRNGLASPQALHYPVEVLGQERPDDGARLIHIHLQSV